MTTTETASSPSLPSGASAFPAHRVQLRDGAALVIRPIRADDGERLQHFHKRLSLTSIRLRYFHLVPFLTEEMVASFTRVDWINQLALVATVAGDDAAATPGQKIIGMANCNRMSPDAAEVAFLVEDAWQGRGIASALLDDVVTCARAHGFRHLLAITLQSNVRMLTVLSRCGFPCAVQRRRDEEVDVWLDITEDVRRSPGSSARTTVPYLFAEGELEAEPTYP